MGSATLQTPSKSRQLGPASRVPDDAPGKIRVIARSRPFVALEYDETSKLKKKACLEFLNSGDLKGGIVKVYHEKERYGGFCSINTHTVVT